MTTPRNAGSGTKAWMLVLAGVGMVLLGVAGWWFAGLLNGPAPVAPPTAIEPPPEAPAAAVVETAVLRDPIRVPDPVITFTTPGRPWSPMAFSSDSKTFLIVDSQYNQQRGTGTIDRLLLCDGATSHVVKTIMGPSDQDAYQIRTAALSGDGRLAVTGSFYGDVRLWDVQAAQEIAHWNEGRLVEAAAFSPDGRRFATAGYMRGVHPEIGMYTAEGKEKVTAVAGRAIETPGNGGIYALAFTPDSKYLVSGGEDRMVRVWEVEGGTLVRTLEGHTQTVDSVAISPDGTTLASGGRDGRLCLWDMATGKLARRMRERGEDVDSLGVHHVAFSPDSQRVVVQARKGAKILDVGTGQTLATLAAYQSLVAAPDGRTLVTPRGIFEIPDNLAPVPGVVVAADEDAPRQAVRIMGTEQPPGRAEEVVLLDVMGGDQCLAVYKRGNGAGWATWDFGTGKEVARRTAAAEGRVLTLSADHRLLATAADDKSLAVWDVRTGAVRRRMAFPAGTFPFTTAFTPDGTFLLAAEGPQRDDGNKADIVVWNLATGEVVRRLQGSAGMIWALGVTPGGRQVISGSGAASGNPLQSSPCFLHIWDLASGRELHRLDAGTALADTLDITPDGRRAITGAYGGSPIVWDLTAAKEIVRLKAFHSTDGRGTVPGVALSADGKWAAVGCDNGDISVVEVDTNAERCRLETHRGRVTGLRFIAGGRQLLSGSVDGTVRLWDLP